MTPTLVRLAPAPVRRIVGSLSETLAVLQALGLEKQGRVMPRKAPTGPRARRPPSRPAERPRGRDSGWASTSGGDERGDPRPHRGAPRDREAAGGADGRRGGHRGGPPRPASSAAARPGGAAAHRRGQAGGDPQRPARSHRAPRSQRAHPLGERDVAAVRRRERVPGARARGRPQLPRGLRPLRRGKDAAGAHEAAEGIRAVLAGGAGSLRRRIPVSLAGEGALVPHDR